MCWVCDLKRIVFWILILYILVVYRKLIKSKLLLYCLVICVFKSYVLSIRNFYLMYGLKKGGW